MPCPNVMEATVGSEYLVDGVKVWSMDISAGRASSEDGSMALLMA